MTRVLPRERPSSRPASATLALLALRVALAKAARSARLDSSRRMLATGSVQVLHFLAKRQEYPSLPSPECPAGSYQDKAGQSQCEGIVTMRKVLLPSCTWPECDNGAHQVGTGATGQASIVDACKCGSGYYDSDVNDNLLTCASKWLHVGTCSVTRCTECDDACNECNGPTDMNCESCATNYVVTQSACKGNVRDARQILVDLSCYLAQCKRDAGSISCGADRFFTPDTVCGSNCSPDTCCTGEQKL